MHLLKGILTSILLLANILFWGALLTIVSVGRLLPFTSRRVIPLLEEIVRRWAHGNEEIIARVHPGVEWRITIEGDLHRDRNYLVIANHISWLDIPVVLKVLRDRISFPKFFLKSELRWAPIVGLGAWALEMPFMKRYSPEYLEKYPEKRGEDLETTRRATRRFGERPGSILSYIEGTRYTRRKHDAQGNQWRWLLTPKLGGIAFVLGAVGDRLHSLVDVTITYPARKRIFWKLLSGQLDWIAVDVVERPIPESLRSEAIVESPELREEFRSWIHSIWDAKDETISARTDH